MNSITILYVIPVKVGIPILMHFKAQTPLEEGDSGFMGVTFLIFYNTISGMIIKNQKKVVRKSSFDLW